MPKPRRSRRRKPRHQKGPAESSLAMIDRLLLTSVRTRSGKASQVTVLAAIVYQLLQQELAGDPRAATALMRYEALVRANPYQGLEVMFADSDYTRSLSEGRAGGGNGGL